jgi:hypothetical protein
MFERVFIDDEALSILDYFRSIWGTEERMPPVAGHLTERAGSRAILSVASGPASREIERLR